jgi:RNA polymerase sigma-70 factor, ECF subfamily
VGITPAQSVEGVLDAGISGAAEAAWSDEFWRASDASAYGLTRGEFDEILLRVGAAQNFGMAAGTRVLPRQQAVWLDALKIGDLVLAHACAAGHERAWEHFVALYHEPLIRAAVAITGSDTLGRDLAGSLYAELYGLKERDGKRRSPLESYRGRGSLMGWLRTTLAQRHVDYHRRSHREQPLDDPELGITPVAPEPAPVAPPPELTQLTTATKQAIAERPAEDRFLLASYYLDGRTLLEIARVLSVHEATVSRKLRRIAGELRKDVLRNLRKAGLSRRAAEEALSADPRDLDLNLKKLLQYSATRAFQEKAAP